VGKRRLSATVCLYARCEGGGDDGWFFFLGRNIMGCISLLLSHLSLSYRTLRLACQYLCLFCIWHIDLNNEFRILIYLSHLARQSQGKFVLFLCPTIFPGGSCPSLLFRSSPPETPSPCLQTVVWGICWPQFIHLWTRWTSDYQLPSILSAAAAAAAGISTLFVGALV